MPPATGVYRCRIRASLRCAGHRITAQPTQLCIRCGRPLLPPPTAAARYLPTAAFDSASRIVPASSRLRSFVGRTPRGLSRWLRTQTPGGPLPAGFVFAASFHFGSRSSSQFISRKRSKPDAVTQTLTNELEKLGERGSEYLTDFG